MSAHDTTGSIDATELLTAQHREVETMWPQLEEARSSGSDLQGELAQGIVTKLSQHDAAEAQLLYPLLREVGGAEGEELSDRSLQEHQQIRELLIDVDGGDIEDSAVYSRLAKCVATVMRHVEEEEQEIFPLLRERCSQEQLVDLGQQIAELQKTAPTHPHKHMPNSKAGAAVAGAIAGVVDRARDAMRE